jgi:FkbM family methyltransferase
MPPIQTVAPGVMSDAPPPPGPLRRLRDLRYRIFYWLLLRRANLTTLCPPGSHCAWTICPDGLNSQSVIYSGGVGSDIGFEHELARQFGCGVVLYDPSPTGIQTMALPENKIPAFQYFPVALAAHRGVLRMAPPKPGDDNWFPRTDADAKLEVPCTDLRSFMEQNSHTHIDLLKMDIEGSEYEVIDDILEKRIPVRQICVEFHHGNLPWIRRSQTIRSVLKLVASGYRLVSHVSGDHTFILRSRSA